MRLYFHYCPSGFSNCYLLGADPVSGSTSSIAAPSSITSSQPEAIIVDPGMMDSILLRIIEENNFSLKGVLITHDHPHHVRGLRAMGRIYDTEIFAINPVVAGHRTNLVHDGEIVNAGPFKVEVFSIPGHSADSAVFRVDRLLFTGDAMTAGLLGSTASSYAATNQVSALRRKILSLPGDYTVLPGHGPPTSLEAERRFNLELNTFGQQKNLRPVFRVEF